jgi:hypothetical protein
VFRYDTDVDEVDLEGIFAAFNAGSGLEDSAYFARRLRSLSVGDVVMVRRQSSTAIWSCESAGWQQRDLGELRMLTAAQAVPAIRARYQFRPGEELAVTVPLAD